jgi:ribosomal protein S18 acetylase RimI-like enzyme
MNDFAIRIAKAEDLPVLRRIWINCFKDSEAETERFFRYFFGSKTSLILSCGNTDAAAAHLLLAAELISDGSSVKCPYIYGVGVLPEYRGMGFGAEITRAITRHCLDLGYDMSVLVPADEGLFAFYREHAGYNDYFTVNEFYIKTDGEFPSGISTARITPNEYNRQRETLLSDLNHLRFSRLACSYLNELCSSSGGGLFQMSYDSNPSAGASAVAAVEVLNDSLLIKELLCRPGEAEYMAKALLNAFGFHSGTVRTPGSQRVFGLSSIQKEGYGYFGFAFD